MEKDSWAVSLIWGRIGAFVLGLAAFILGMLGYNVSPEDTTLAYDLIAGILGGIGGLLALISKIREGIRARSGG